MAITDDDEFFSLLQIISFKTKCQYEFCDDKHRVISQITTNTVLCHLVSGLVITVNLHC